ncbi:hypothetical protein B0H19DRAFT_1085161 [Mycena capillaripes]|nr:hypothetical protein B0H19DRAFT_1085161 [Mycena capillaripes]
MHRALSLEEKRDGSEALIRDLTIHRFRRSRWGSSQPPSSKHGVSTSSAVLSSSFAAFGTHPSNTLGVVNDDQPKKIKRKMSFVGNMVYSGYTTGNPYTEQAVRTNGSAGRRKTLRGAQHTRLVHHHWLEEPAPMSAQAALDKARTAMQAGKSALRSTCSAHRPLPRRRTSAKYHTTGTHIGSSTSATLLTRTYAHRRRVHSNAAAPSPRSMYATAMQRDPEVLHALKQSHDAKGTPTGGRRGAARSPHRSNPIVDSTATTAPRYAVRSTVHRARIGTSTPWNRTRAHLDAVIAHGGSSENAATLPLPPSRPCRQSRWVESPVRICIGFGGIALVFRLWPDQSCAGHSPDADERDGAVGRGDGHKRQRFRGQKGGGRSTIENVGPAGWEEAKNSRGDPGKVLWGERPSRLLLGHTWEYRRFQVPLRLSLLSSFTQF